MKMNTRILEEGEQRLAKKTLQEDNWSEILDVHEQNANTKLLLRSISQSLDELCEKRYIQAHPELLSKCEEINTYLHKVQLDLTDIGTILDQELFNASKNLAKGTEVFLVDLDKSYVVDEKDDTICFTLPELIPQRDDITTPTFWLNKRNVKESPLNGNYYQLKIYTDKEITAYQYDDNRKQEGKAKISAESFINTIMNSNELMRESDIDNMVIGVTR